MTHRLRRARIDDSGSVDMTPMLDIVFIMLIFFIVTAVFMDEHALAFTTPPESAVLAPPTETISVFINAKDQIVVDNVVTDVRGVSARVERLLADKPNASIILTADAQASLDPIVSIQDQMNIAGRSLVLKVNPPK